MTLYLITIALALIAYLIQNAYRRRKEHERYHCNTAISASRGNNRQSAVAVSGPNPGKLASGHSAGQSLAETKALRKYTRRLAAG